VRENNGDSIISGIVIFLFLPTQLTNPPLIPAKNNNLLKITLTTAFQPDFIIFGLL
jgi:hypothetical protein